jgi:hypothetical protein
MPTPKKLTQAAYKRAVHAISGGHRRAPQSVDRRFKKAVSRLTGRRA